jgi:catalase
MITDETFPVDGRVVHILANDGADLAGVTALKDALLAAGAAPHVIATHKGAIAGAGDGPSELTVDRSFHTASSAEADAVVVSDRAALASIPAAHTYVQAAYRHQKTLGAWGDGVELLTGAGVDVDAAGIVTSAGSSTAFAEEIVAAMGKHRHWERLAPHPTRLDTGASDAERN